MKKQNPEGALPGIRQTLFILDTNRQYQFDVNQDITIRKLKKMIIAAADLGKLGLRIFHEGKEYTDKEEFALDQLFPDLQLVIFDLRVSYDKVEDLDELVELKFKRYCPEPGHAGKYPYFYCFSCGRSICSECLRNHDHDGHKIKEKYDYLQNSRNLVELLFKDLNDLVNDTKGASVENINALKSKVSIQFFPELVKMVKKIEDKMLELIIFFFEKEKVNFETIKNNILSLKNHCSEGLDLLKDKIGIEDMMIDEEIFLTFDSKFNQIGNEKENFKQDILKYKRFAETLYLIEQVITKTYREIYDFLKKYLKATEYEDIKNKINSQNIDVIKKKEIIDKILSSIKLKPKESLGRDYSPTPFINTYKKAGGVQNQNIITNPFDLNLENPNKNFDNKLIGKKREGDNLMNLKENNTRGGVITRSGAGGGFGNNRETSLNEKGDVNEVKLKGVKKVLPINEEENEVVEVEESEKSNSPVYYFICNVVPKTDNLILYNADLDKADRQVINFIPSFGINHFLPESAWVNCNNKLYISGGDDDTGKLSNIFIEFDPLKGSIRPLVPSQYEHSCHSLLGEDNFIYAVGGQALECEKYDIKNNNWLPLPPLPDIQNYPVLYIHKNMLYSFFGTDENEEFVDKIYRLNLRNEKAKWQPLSYKRNGCNLKMYGCGIVKVSDNCIYLIGGRDNDGIRKEAIQFDFSNNTASNTEFVLEDKGYFKDTTLHKLPSGSYGNFSIDENNNFLKIFFRVRVTKVKA